MTQQPNYSPPRGDSGTSVPETARTEAAEVTRSATERASEVASVAGEQAKQVASETGRQARHLLEEGVQQLRGQAQEGQQKLADGLRGLADQLHQMSERAEGSDTVSEAVRQVSDRTHSVAAWLESRQPGDLLDELRTFARRRPGLFLAGAAAAGLLAGRLTRNLASATRDGESGEAHRPGALGERTEPQTADIPLPGSAGDPGYPPPPAMAQQPPPGPPPSGGPPPAYPPPPGGPPPAYPPAPGAPYPTTGPTGYPDPGPVRS
jgi:hypothetical protein